jgi:hypothetical protein
MASPPILGRERCGSIQEILTRKAFAVLSSGFCALSADDGKMRRTVADGDYCDAQSVQRMVLRRPQNL